MSLVSLKTELRQELKLTPQLLQSMEILQMNSQELLEYLGRATEENPLLEQEDASSLRSAYEELRQKASWIDGGVYGSTFTHEENELPERGAMDRETESLSSFLCDQLDRKHLPKPLLALSRYIAELVDEDGYLAQEDLDLPLLEFLAEDPVPKALLTVYETSGSTPVKSGAMMAVGRDLRTAGTIGGGCSEDALRREALRLIGTGGCRCVTVDMSQDVAEEEGMVCGGQMKVLIEDVTE